MKRLIIIYLALLLSVSYLFSGDIAGVIIDKNQNPIKSVNISIENTYTGKIRNYISTKHGGFISQNITNGLYSIMIHRIGYEDTTIVVRVLDDEKILKIVLREKVIILKPYIKRANFAEIFETPITFSDIRYKDFNMRYFTEELPVILQMEPGINFYSDDGIGVGYSYISLRGFNQQRIAVLINGVPLNDAESNEVFWVDYADFLDNVERIQIHRGVSNALVGYGGIGGLINIVTKDYSEEPQWKTEGVFGSFGTLKYNVSYNSGMIANKFAFYSRFSRIKSNGYRNDSWSDIWSYFIGGTYYYNKGNITLNLYGGPENVHLAYNGITREYLEGDITGDIFNDRRFNPIDYKDAVDYFNQPHYELISNHLIDKNIGIKNTVSLYTGSGYYKQFKNNVHLYEYYLPDIITGNDTIARSDIIRKRMVNEYDVFWLPEFSLNHILGELIIAGNVRYHFANHKGDVIWAEHYPDNIGPDWTYYNYDVTKDHYKLVLSEKTKIGDKFILLTAAEMEYLKYHYFADSIKTNIDFNVPTVFANPKVGVNYNINKIFGLYFSFGMASRMPGLDNYYDADHPYWSYPLFKDTMNFTDPYIKPERLNDYEFGVNIVYGQYIESKINLYYMDFKNELVYNGQLDDNGVPIVGNAKKSFHSGIEISNRINIFKHLDIILNGSYNYNKLIDYMGYTMDWNTYTADSVDLSGNLAGGFPICLFFGSIKYNINNFSIEIMDRLTGKQYIGNTMDENTAIRPYNIVNTNLSYMYKCFELSANVNNIFNTLTATNGYMDEGTAYYFPNAIRNYNVKLRISF